VSSAFISYSVKDEELARGLHSATSMAGIDTFLASISIEPGCNWTDAIFEKLDKAQWVFFIATKNSINSSAVQQELGASLIQKKTIIPLLVDITPEELPGWVGNHQAIDLKNGPEALHKTISNISEKLNIDRFWSGVLVGAIICGLGLVLLNSKT